MMGVFATNSDESKTRKNNLQHKGFRKHYVYKVFWSEIFFNTCPG